MIGVNSTGEEFAISLWMRGVQAGPSGEARYVTVIEPVIRMELKIAVSCHLP